MVRSIIALLLSVVLISSCGLFQKAASDSDSEDTAIQATKAEEVAFIQDVIADLQAKKLKLLADRYPSEFLARAISGPKAATMSDEQIRFEMLDPLKERLEGNWVVLMEGLDANGIESKSLTYSSHSVTYTGDPAKQPNALLLYVNGVKDGVSHTYELAFTFLEFNDRWYVFELLRSQGIFDQP